MHGRKSHKSPPNEGDVDRSDAAVMAWIGVAIIAGTSLVLSTYASLLKLLG